MTAMQLVFAEPDFHAALAKRGLAPDPDLIQVLLLLPVVLVLLALARWCGWCCLLALLVLRGLLLGRCWDVM